MAMPTDEELRLMQKNVNVLRKLSNEQLTFVALAALIEVVDAIPVGNRIPLVTVLRERAEVSGAKKSEQESSMPSMTMWPNPHGDEKG